MKRVSTQIVMLKINNNNNNKGDEYCDKMQK